MTDFGAYLTVQKAYLIGQKAYLIGANSRGKCNGLISLIGLISLVPLIRLIDEIKIGGCFHSFIDSFKHTLKDKPKSKPFSYGINTKHPLDDYPVNSLFCFVEDDYAVIDSLAELEKKIAWWADNPDALREEVGPRQQLAKWFEKEYEFQQEQSERR